MTGLSRSNLMYMRAFAQAWPDNEIVPHLVGQLNSSRSIQFAHPIHHLFRLLPIVPTKMKLVRQTDGGQSRKAIVILSLMATLLLVACANPDENDKAACVPAEDLLLTTELAELEPSAPFRSETGLIEVITLRILQPNPLTSALSSRSLFVLAADAEPNIGIAANDTVTIGDQRVPSVDLGKPAVVALEPGDYRIYTTGSLEIEVRECAVNQ